MHKLSQEVHCPLCAGTSEPYLEKKGADGKLYSVYRCTRCTLWHLHPLPKDTELFSLYQSNYFKARSDRGYSDYTSKKVEESVIQTLQKNLTDLKFFKWELSLHEKRLLEVGSAAGHAVGYFAERGWETQGLDIAEEMVERGRARGLNLVAADFLQFDFSKKKFSLITHWATLEHLPNAQLFLRKMAELLLPEGRIYLSTCNTGLFAKIRGVEWRYLNVPEHVFYFNKKSLIQLAKSSGLCIVRSFSYGSGFTARENASWGYKLTKRIADTLARYFLWGDMVVVELQRAQSKFRPSSTARL